MQTHLERANDDNRLRGCCVDAELDLSLDFRVPSNLQDIPYTVTHAHTNNLGRLHTCW